MEEVTVTEQLRAAVNPPLVPTERLVLRKPEALEAGLARVGEALRPLQTWLVGALASRRGLEADLGSEAVTRLQAIVATGPERPWVVAATLAAAHGVGPVLQALVTPLAVVNVARMEGKARIGWLVAAGGETGGGVAIGPALTPWILALRPFVRAASEAERSDYARRVAEARSRSSLEQRAAWARTFENEAWAAEDAALLAAGTHGLPAYRISSVARCLLPYLESEAAFDAVAAVAGSELFTTSVYAEVLMRPPVPRAVRRLTVLLAKPLEKESTAHVIQIAEVLACVRSEDAAVAIASAAHLARGPAKAYFAAHPDYLRHLEAAASGRGRNAATVREIVVELERQRAMAGAGDDAMATEHLPRCIASPPWLTREAPWPARDLDVIVDRERVVETEALRRFREQMGRSTKQSTPERDAEILGAKGALDPARFFELSDDAALANVHRLAAYSLGCAVARFGALAIPRLAALMTAKPLKTHADLLEQLRTPRLARVAWSFHEDEAWILGDPEASALGLVPDLFAVQLHHRYAAEMGLLRLCVAGHRAAVERAAARYGNDVASDVRRILDRDPAQRLPDPLPAIHAKFEDGSLPVLTTEHGPLPPSANATIGKLLAVSPAWLPHPGIEELRATCTQASRDAFAWEVYRKTFGMKVLSLLGGDGCARNLDAELSSARSKLSPAQHHEAYEVLARIGTPLSRALLAKHALLSPWRDRNERIDGLLGTSLPEDTLLALDIDPDRVTLDYGPRTFRVLVDEHLQPWVVDEGKKRTPKLPKPTKKDDAEKAAAAAEAFDALRLDLDDHRQTALLGLERALAEGRTWNLARLRRIVGHPLLGRLARRLVWEELGPPSRFFRVAEDGTFADEADAALELGEDATVALTHPVRIPDAVRDRFHQILHDYAIIQPFEQLQRESYRASDEERAATELTRFDGRRVASARLEGLLGARGWQHGGHTTMHKPIGEYLAVLEIPRRAVHARGATAADQLGKVTLRGPTGTATLGALTAVQASELLRDLETLPSA